MPRVPVVAGLLGSLALIAVLVISQAPSPAPAQAPQSRPNVLLVMTDDQTVEQMQAMGRVRELVGAAGTTFERNFVNYPLCCPSRSTLLTGQYAHNHGVLGNRAPSGGYEKLDERGTLPVALSGAGYATAHIGKYLNGYGRENPRKVPPGWQEWFGSVDPTTYDYSAFCLNENAMLVGYGATDAVRRACPGAQERPSQYQGDRYSDLAVDYVSRRAPEPRPFFLSVAYLAPHGGGPNGAGIPCSGSAKPAPRHAGAFASAPLPRPASFNEPDVSDKPVHIRTLPTLKPRRVARITGSYRCRRASLLAVDEGVGRIVDALRASGELGNTMIIFTADNGFFQGEHRVASGKLKPYEPSVRVPALLRGPGVPAGRRVTALTANVDLSATILDAAGARPQRRQDGVSLRAVANDPGAQRDRAILLESGPQNGPRNPRYRAIRTDRYKLVDHEGSIGGELYDLARDPGELRNRFGDPRLRAVRARLTAALARLDGCAGDGCRAPVRGVE